MKWQPDKRRQLIIVNDNHFGMDCHNNFWFSGIPIIFKIEEEMSLNRVLRKIFSNNPPTTLIVF